MGGHLWQLTWRERVALRCAAAGEFLLTGKRWRIVYHVRLVAARSRKRPQDMLLG